MSKLQKSIITIIGLLLLFELALYFGVNDLQIWLTYGNPTGKFGLIMEVIGEIVAPLIFIASGIIIAIYYFNEPKSKLSYFKFVCGIACSIAGFAYSIIVFTRMKNIWFVIGGTAVTLILVAALLMILRKVDPGKLFQFYCIALTAVFYCIAVLAIITLIKVFWGRVRPRDLETLEQFTPWYIPHGITGNRSFPSGHTANASTLIVITMFSPLIKNIVGKIFLFGVPAVWIAIMAASRVSIGAHYCSDTLFAAAISIVLFIFIKKYTIKFIANTLE